jgi:aminoglycoside 6'-N-acetyltransferase I
MEIREAREGDFEQWVRMRTELWPEHPEKHAPDIRNYFQGKNINLEVAFVGEESEGRQGGFIEISIRNHASGATSFPVPDIEGWYVDEELRGKGHGALPVARAEQWSREKEYNEIGSDALAENEGSIRAHRALGFREVERSVCFIKKL